jgi:hypothetical protein
MVMSDDPIIANAAAAAASPADGPPPERTAIQQTYEQLRAAAAERFEQGQRERAQVAAQTKTDAALSPVERVIAKLRAHPAFYDAKHAEHGDVMRQYHAALANDPADPAYLDADTVAAQDVAQWSTSLRERFGIEPPELHGLERGPDYDLHSGNALAYLAREGVEASVVGGLYTDFHDEATLGGGVLDDAAIERLAKRWGPKLGKAATERLTRWYREEVLGGGAP